MDREEMINALLDDDVELFHSGLIDGSYIMDMRFHGFQGYENMTDDEIKEEYDSRF